MVKIALKIKATLENIAELKPGGPEFRWWLRFICTNCNEETENWNYVTLSEEIPAEHGKDVYHFTYKCRLCLLVNTLRILKDSIKPYRAADEEKFQTIVVFHCKGLKPIDFSPRDGWIAKAIDDGKEFTGVDLTEGEWADFCDEIQQPVAVYDIEHNFERIKWNE